MNDATTEKRRHDRYVVRPYEPDDREDFLALYRLVFGDASDEWFDWKYADNPFLDRVPVTVAEADGEVVGAKPTFALRYSTPGGESIALQSSDVMVHPDHRRRGLFSRMIRLLLDRYGDRDEVSLFFLFPNEMTLAGSLKAGWEVVESVPTYYRIQNPGNYFDFDGDDALGRAATRGANLAAEGYLGVRDLLADRPSDVTVRRRDEVPVELFADLSAPVADRLHAVRDETFFAWRFRNPRWEYRSYVAERRGEPVAGLVVGRADRDGASVVNVADVVPLTAGRRRETASALLAAVLADHRDADTVSCVGRALPADLLASYGFRSDAKLPLSRFTESLTLAARPAGDDWRIGGLDVREPSSWAVSPAELDTT